MNKKLPFINHLMQKVLISLGGLMATVPSMGQAPYSWEADLHHRLCCDFDQTEDEVTAYIRRYIPDVTAAQLDQWEKTGALEARIIDGNKRYFHRAAQNLFLIDRDCRAIKNKKDGIKPSASATVDAENIPAIMREASGRTHYLAKPKPIHLKYTLTVKADAVPDGETVRCWLPFPRRDILRQKDVKLLGTSEKHYILSSDTCLHSSLYMEKKARRGVPTVFTEEFSFTSSGYWRGLKPEDVQPYDTSTDLYKQFTSERDRHIVFTPQLRRLADSLTAGTDNPLIRARRIFHYIDTNFPWASAREYSTLDNIPEYVLEYRHGDCGQVSLLFITLCRIAGIPAHFQSGFMLHPGEVNLHDWAEIYFQGIGWVPVDQSFGIPTWAKNDQETYFFVGGMDSWRMVVNQDYGQPLSPAKTFPRSETVDFQRGEVEWRGGNLYFDKWKWNIEAIN